MPKKSDPIDEPIETDVEAVESTRTTHLTAPVLALLAFALVAILGLLYWWFITIETTSQTLDTEPTTRPTAEQNNEPESTTAEAQVGSFGVISTSDEIDAIEADLESTDLDALDAELNAIEAELEASSEAEAQ